MDIILHPPSSRIALVVVDVQQGFEDPKWGARNNPAAEANIASLIERWRMLDRPVIHVFHDSAEPDSPLRPDRPGNLPRHEAQPGPGEPIYRKTVNNAFIGTPLEPDLRSANIDTLVIVGLTTNHCVSTTARMAGNLGFKTYVVSDATATFDRAGIDGEVRLAADVHAAALSDLNGEFAVVVNTVTALTLAASEAC